MKHILGLIMGGMLAICVPLALIIWVFVSMWNTTGSLVNDIDDYVHEKLNKDE